jgi:uncharacterized protein (DUF608 family)
MAYDITTKREQKPRSGVALGGLGCGWFELRQDGTFQNWNIFNNRPLGRGKHFPFPAHSVLFFLIRYQIQGQNPRLVLLQIEESHGAASFEGHEVQYIFPWLSGVDTIRMRATFPFVDLDFEERDLPLKVHLRAWSPFIPRDAKNSSLPAAFFDFSVVSRSSKPVTVSLLASFRNCVGYDVREKHYTSRVGKGKGYVAFEHGARHLNPAHASAGTMGIASLHKDSHYYLGWEHPHPYYEVLLRNTELPDIDDTEGRNKTEADGRPGTMDRAWSTIGRTVTLKKKGASLEHTFAATWHFPNNYARIDGDEDLEAGYLEDENFPGSAKAAVSEGQTQERHIEGHYYSNFFRDALDVAAYAVAHQDDLRARTRAFHDAFYASSAETWLLDQVNSNLNTFRTSSWFTKEGNFGILEGLSPTKSYAGLSTTDVAMYGGVATAALFPELDRAVTRSHLRFQKENGVVAHSITQNYRQIKASELSGKRIDMPAQYAYMGLRAFFWSGDRAFLEEIWPSVKKALDYVLRERDANGDLLPDMEGIMCSYDNFPMYGVAPYVATQWLVAVSAAVEAARVLGDNEAERHYADVLAKGRARLESTSWNGRYYRLYSDRDGKRGDADEGCLTDQIIGQWAAHLAGLPGLLDPKRVKAALRSILKMNYKKDQGVRNCQWPGDKFLHPVADDCWVDQANTCWTGVELAFASFLIYEGLVKEGIEVARNVDERHRRWGIYWDHQEFGGHYFRPMSAWAIIPALLGQRLRDGQITFDPRLQDKKLKLFFTTSDGYGHFVRGKNAVEIRVLDGEIKERIFRIRARAIRTVGSAVTLNGRPLRGTRVQLEQGFVLWSLPPETRLAAGSVLEIHAV